MEFCFIDFEHGNYDEAEWAFAGSRTSINEQIMVSGNEYKARPGYAGLCLLCNYNACLKIIGESAWK